MAWIYTRKLTGFPNFPFPFFPTEYMFPFIPFPFLPCPFLPFPFFPFPFYPKPTFHTRVTGKTEMGARSGRPTALSFEHEKRLADYAGNRASLGTGFSRRPFLQYAKQFAEKHGATFAQGLPTDCWWAGMRGKTSGTSTSAARNAPQMHRSS